MISERDEALERLLRDEAQSEPLKVTDRAYATMCRKDLAASGSKETLGLPPADPAGFARELIRLRERKKP